MGGGCTRFSVMRQIILTQSIFRPGFENVLHNPGWQQSVGERQGKHNPVDSPVCLISFLCHWPGYCTERTQVDVGGTVLHWFWSRLVDQKSDWGVINTWMAPNSTFQLSQVKDRHLNMESRDGNELNDKLKLNLDSTGVLFVDIKANRRL